MDMHTLNLQGYLYPNQVGILFHKCSAMFLRGQKKHYFIYPTAQLFLHSVLHEHRMNTCTCNHSGRGERVSKLNPATNDRQLHDERPAV